MNKKNLGLKIKELKDLGYSYRKIAIALNCSKGSISYHLGDNQKEKSHKRCIKNREKNHPFVRKIEHFLYNYNRKGRKIQINTLKKIDSIIYDKITRFNRINKKNGDYGKMTFSLQDVINKIGISPKCYLTGDDIDINQPRTYNFDHIIPRSRGGTNELDNLGICTKEVNQAKFNMTPDEFINLCKKVLIHNGYDVTKTSP